MINTLNSLTFLQSEHIQSIITSLINTVQSLHTLNQKMYSNGMDLLYFKYIIIFFFLKKLFALQFISIS